MFNIAKYFYTSKNYLRKYGLVNNPRDKWPHVRHSEERQSDERKLQKAFKRGIHLPLILSMEYPIESQNESQIHARLQIVAYNAEREINEVREGSKTYR